MLVRGVVESELVDRFVRLAVRSIVDAQAALFLNRVALVVEAIFRDRQRLHPIRLEEDRGFELVGRHRLEIERAFLVGRAVHAAAVGEDRV